MDRDYRLESENDAWRLVLLEDGEVVREGFYEQLEQALAMANVWLNESNKAEDDG